MKGSYSVSALAFQTAAAFALLVGSAVLLISIFDAEAQDGFYPPLPQTAPPTPTPPPTVCNLTEEFDNITNLTGQGWVMRNNSEPIGNTNWFQGNATVFGSLTGASNSYIAANYLNGSGTSTLSNWLITPPITLQNGAQLGFWTRTVNGPLYPDRLQVRMSTNGTSSDVGSTSASVGDFTTLLLDLNPSYTRSGYPNAWSHVEITLSGIASPVNGRIALRYFAENGGPNGGNSDYIGIDSLQYCCGSCGFPTPTPTPTPSPTPTTPTPSPSPSASPCSCNGLSVFGVVTNCSKGSRTAPVANVVLTMGLDSTPTPPPFATAITDSNGNYAFDRISPMGQPQFVRVTPSKTSLTPGSFGISTVDVLAIQRHFLGLAFLSGCRQTAADVNQDSMIDTLDVIAIQRFFLGNSTGIANVGKFSFSPAIRNYTLQNDQHWFDQNYSAIVFGDVSEPFTP